MELWWDGQRGVMQVWGTQSGFVPVPGNLECNRTCGSSKQLVLFLRVKSSRMKIQFYTFDKLA